MKATIPITVFVTLDVPEEFRGAITKDDLRNMAKGAVPESPIIGTREGVINGIQVEVDGVCQELEGQPVMADVFIETDMANDDAEVEFEDEDFTGGARHA